jgi:hypothetical protein
MRSKSEPPMKSCSAVLARGLPVNNHTFDLRYVSAWVYGKKDPAPNLICLCTPSPLTTPLQVAM